MKSIKLFLDKILSNIEKISPDLYRNIVYENGYKIYSEIANSIKYKDKYFFHSVSLEISTYCNRKCHYCPNKDYETPKNFMSWDIFKSAIAQLKDIKYTGIFQYHLFNEPLFDERLTDFVRYTSTHLPKVTRVLISNGDLLNIEKAKELSEAGVDKFVVTVHDANPERNLERLKPVKEFLKEKMRLQTSNELYLTNRGGLIDIEDEKRKADYKKCPYIRTLTIGYNGDVILCCHDYFRKYIMGNVMEKSILEIWNSYHNLRKQLLKYNNPELPICKICLKRE